MLSKVQLAGELAARARGLRALALASLARGGALAKLHRELAATQTREQFADDYAQAVAYGLLALRWSAPERPFRREQIARLLPAIQGGSCDLLARLIDRQYCEPLSRDVDGLCDFLARAPIVNMFIGEPDPIIHFYQDFLAAYDPAQRKQHGVYYTPAALVDYIVNTVDAALRDELGLPLGLADPTSWAEYAEARALPIPPGVAPQAAFVQVLDPATGTGAFLLRVIERVHATMRAEYARAGLAEAEARRRWSAYVRADLLPRLHGFELALAPYLVCRLRLGLALRQTGFEFGPDDRLELILGDALARPDHAGAISVILGNPPYEREPAEGGGAHKGGWIRDGHRGWREGRPPLEDYAEPARAAGAGGHLKNLYNLYVYFWRWASWRVFEREPKPGIVALITGSSYLRGPGFAGMREHLRRVGDSIYVLDLEGDQKGARKSANVFDIQIPVAVTCVIAQREPTLAEPATAHYRRVAGERADKLAFCRARTRLAEVDWAPCPAGWTAELIAAERSSYFAWPRLTDLFPWQHSGVQYKRKWPIAETVALLEARWAALLEGEGEDRAEAFRETAAWTIAGEFEPLLDGPRKPAIATLAPRAALPRVLRYGYRSFDRQWAIVDERLGDRLRPPLWRSFGARQVYLVSLLTKVLGPGPAAVASAQVPDLDYFCNRGGKDVIPLWRDAEARAANLAAGFWAELTARYGRRPRAEDVFAYAYAVLANPGYVARFADALQVPGPRLPITTSARLFERGAGLGREMLRWHSYAERFCDDHDEFAITGEAKLIAAIPSAPDAYPNNYSYDEGRRVLVVGAGELGPVAPEVWGFRVSGLQVVKSWLDYRMKAAAGKKSSPLDELRPERWTDAMTRELLELLWVLEASLARYPQLDAWLDEVLAGELLDAEAIPAPADAERRPLTASPSPPRSGRAGSRR